MEKNLRLRSNQDFKKVYARGKSYRNRNFILIVRPNALSRPRVGFSITKKTGNSVTRNRLKRQLREIVRLNRKALKKPLDMIVIPRKNTLDLSYQQLESSLLHVLRLSMQGKKKPKWIGSWFAWSKHIKSIYPAIWGKTNADSIPPVHHMRCRRIKSTAFLKQPDCLYIGFCGAIHSVKADTIRSNNTEEAIWVYCVTYWAAWFGSSSSSYRRSFRRNRRRSRIWRFRSS